MPFSGVCATYGCHAGWKSAEECATCHHTLLDDKEAWKKAHPKAVQAIGPNACLETCHDADQCRLCHTTGKIPVFTGLAAQTGLKAIEALHVKANWMEQHGTLALADKSKCLVCHVSEGECQDCHALRPAFHGSTKTWIGDAQGAREAEGTVSGVPQGAVVQRVPRSVQGDALGDRERRADRRSKVTAKGRRVQEALVAARRRRDPGRARRGLPAAVLDDAAGLLRRYPGMSARMENWKNSTHARVSCIACHVEPGLQGLRGVTGSRRFPRSTRSSSWELRRPTCSSRRVSPRVRSATRTTARSRPTATC